MKEEKIRNVCSCKNIPAQTSAEQTVLFSLLCVLVSDARFLLFLSVMQCMHFVLPFLYFKKKMGLLSFCLWLTAIPTLKHSKCFIFSAPSHFRKEYQLFQKCEAAFVSCLKLFWVISMFKLFAYFSWKYSWWGTSRGSCWKSFAPI